MVPQDPRAFPIVRRTVEVRGEDSDPVLRTWNLLDLSAAFLSVFI